MKRRCGELIVVGCVLLGSTVALGECPTIDFENLAVGTAVTTQYSGVVFAVTPQTCEGIPQLFMRIANPGGGASSGTKGLKIDGGCPDFSDDFLVMTFTRGQREVRFNVGDWGTTYTVRVYSGAVGGVPFLTQSVVTGAPGNVGVFRSVRVKPSAAQPDIKRIEIQGATSTFEAIDDLQFDIDETPPTADITAPAGSPAGIETCACGLVAVRGVACDEDGVYGHDTLEYRASGAATWTQVGSVTSPLCDEGTLYNWNTAPAGITEGYYDLRLTVENRCELSATDVSTVYVDKHFSLTGAEVRSPANGAVLGGDVCFDGTVWDRCFENYTVMAHPSAGGAFAAVDPAHPSYTATVINDPFAVWHTSGAVADGSYVTRVHAEDVCGNTAEVMRTVTIDNTAPTAVISTPSDCDYVEGVMQIRGTVSDANLEGWSLAYSGGDAVGWVTISAGNGSIGAGGLIGNWDTTLLRHCAYTLRLRVVDKAVLNCNGSSRHEKEDYISVNIGYAGDFDADDDGDIDLIDYGAFQDDFTGPLP